MFSGEFKVALVKEVFRDDDGDGLHDVVLEALDEQLTDEELRVFFYNLPYEIQITALQWGLSDTQFREDTFREISKQRAGYKFDIKKGRK